MAEINPYYAPVVKGYPEIDNGTAVAEWFESTEPEGGEPKHTRVLHVDTARAINYKFLVRLRMRLALAAQFAPDRPPAMLHGRNNKLQPIADRIPATDE